MNQTTHAWIAIRAIKLLEDEGSVPNLVRLLLPFTQEASIGAWIPGKRDAKFGSSMTQNHVFKIGPYKAEDPQVLKSRFVIKKEKLLDEIDLVIMHDSVLNVAIIWKDVWLKFNNYNFALPIRKLNES